MSSDEDDYFDVKMPPEVAAQWQSFLPPGFPPVEELVLRMDREQKCGVCGGDTANGEIHAMEPDYVDQDGVLHGKVICGSCLEKGE